MLSWILGLVTFWGLAFILHLKSKPVDRGITEDDYKNMQRQWEEEDRDREMYRDALEAEIDTQIEQNHLSEDEELANFYSQCFQSSSSSNTEGNRQ